jgi:PKD repeat protein
MRGPFPQFTILTFSFLFIIMLSPSCKDDPDPEPPPGLKAAFSAIPFEGHSPLVVGFKDESSGSPASWKWDFQGDGSYDADISDPSYTYDGPGFYDVKLVVSNSEKSDSITIINYIYLNRDDVQLDYEDVLSAGIGELAEIPLKIGHDAGFGAMTIKLFYDNRLIEVEAIVGGPAGLVSSIVHENGSIAIAWSSVAPFIVKQNDALFIIKATILREIDAVSHYLRIEAGTEFADPNTVLVPGVGLVVPYIDTRE